MPVTPIISPDSAWVVTASSDNAARVWNAATGVEITALRGHKDAVFSATFSPNGTRLLTASLDRTAWVWNAATGVEIAVLSGHRDMVESAPSRQRDPGGDRRPGRYGAGLGPVRFETATPSPSPANASAITSTSATYENATALARSRRSAVTSPDAGSTGAG